MAVRAAGLLIFRRFSETLQFLLMQTSYGSHHWTPPKGHVDPGESDEDTAFRETEEESGLKKEDLLVFTDFKRVLKYNVNNKEKDVVYWLAELKNPDVPVRMSDEHQDYKWLETNDACKLVVFPNMQDLIKEAENFIKSKK